MHNKHNTMLYTVRLQSSQEDQDNLGARGNRSGCKKKTVEKETNIRKIFICNTYTGFLLKENHRCTKPILHHVNKKYYMQYTNTHLNSSFYQSLLSKLITINPGKCNTNIHTKKITD